MAGKKPPRSKVNVTASAKVSATASASYQRKKLVTEVIPVDVTRAKTSAWLDLISPITEWAGIKGDTLRHKRSMIRVQQEAALEKLAALVKEKADGKDIKYPLPAKILVPAFEAASLEDPDSKLIDWWANLLVSGATSAPLRPYFIDLMTKIDHPEADFLDKLWISFVEGFSNNKLALENPRFARDFVTWHVKDKLDPLLNALISEEGRIKRDATETLSDAIKRVGTARSNEIGKQMHTLSAWGDSIGIPLELTVPVYVGEFRTVRGQYSGLIEQAGASVDVCKAASILQQHVHFEPIPGRIGLDARYDIRLLEFTLLGAEFMGACRPVTSGK